MTPLSNRAKRRQLERQLKNGKSIPSLSPQQLLYQVKYELNEFQAKNLLNGLPSEIKEYFEGAPLPKTYKDIRSSGQTYVEDYLEKELSWYQSSIKKYASQINLYLNLESKFDIIEKENMPI